MIKRMVEKFQRWNDDRADIGELNRMSDRELNDIGMHRGDIYRVVVLGQARNSRGQELN